MSRRGWVWTGVVAASLILAGVVYAAATPVERTSVAAEGMQLRADFGLRQTPVTRFFDVDVCSLPHKDAFAECSNDGGDQGSAPERTEISSAAVISDLAEVDPDAPLNEAGKCAVQHTGSQFPASQFKTSAENRGSRGLAITLSADPSQPEGVEPGTYCGAVVVQLQTGEFVRVNLAASLSDRGQGGLRFRVILALFLGALAGGLIKWLGDKYSPVSVLRRRQRRLLRRLGGYLAYLPERVQDDLENIKDGIGHFDPEGVDELLKDLEKRSDDLARFGTAMLEIDQLLAELSDAQTQSWEPDVGALLQFAIAKQSDLLVAKYPWQDADGLCDSAEGLRTSLRAVKRAIASGDERAYRQAARAMFADDTEFSDVIELGRNPDRRPITYASLASAHRSEPVKLRRSPQQFLLDNVLMITMLSVALVVTIVGYKTQFLDDLSFDGGNGDYLALFLWAFALQVAGVTVGEVVGKLTRGATSSVATTPGT